MGSLKIGEVAKRAGVGVETVRFYEREGLLDEPARRASGYREYSPDAVARLRFIRRSKDLGFSLREIKDLIALTGDAGATRAELRRRASAKIADIEERVRDLLRIQKALRSLTETCNGHGPLRGCPIFEALDAPPEATDANGR
ncbi:MAG: MerR family transcriptional regulator [Gemmataceae bacterium]